MNNSNRFKILIGGWLILLLLAGCQMPGAQPPPPPTATTVPVDVVLTEAAETIFAGMKTPTVQLVPDTSTPLPVVTETPEGPTQTPLVTDTLQPTDTLAPLPAASLTPEFTFTASPTTVQLSGVFEDDFEEAEGWAKADQSTYGMGYSSGSYFIRVNMLTEDAPVYSVRSYYFDNLVAGVDVVKTEGPENAFFGVVCRFTDSKNYYRFVVGRDGYYNIGKRLQGTFVDLGSGSKPESYKKDAINQVRASCIGNVLALFLNGTKLLEVTDYSFTVGKIGLVVGTRNDKKTVIYFDNYAVAKP